ncbi:hypothetical protein H8959_002684 [Pygathrix nigripes]
MSTAPTSNGVFVVIPPSNASGLRPPPAILPTSMCQPPGIMQFEEPPPGAQTPRATQPPDLQPEETFLTGEPKVLGGKNSLSAQPEAGPLAQTCWNSTLIAAPHPLVRWRGGTGLGAQTLRTTLPLTCGPWRRTVLSIDRHSISGSGCFPRRNGSDCGGLPAEERSTRKGSHAGALDAMRCCAL